MCNESDQMKVMCFDTTTSNTDSKSGTYMLLEQRLDKNNMLWLVCQHRIFEIVLEAVVSVFLSFSTGRDIQMFKKFKVKWVKIYKYSYQMAIDDLNVAEKISDSEGII